MSSPPPLLGPSVLRHLRMSLLVSDKRRSPYLSSPSGLHSTILGVGLLPLDFVPSTSIPLDLRRSSTRRNLDSDTRKQWEHRKRQVRCLAHIVNLAMQALLSAHNKSKAYNPQEPNADLVAHRNTEHDEIGVVHLLQDKPNHSSHKQPLQLLLDMPIRWSSMYVMLERSDTLKEDVDTFICEMAIAEKDRKRQNGFLISSSLMLNGSEKAQQSFSSDSGPVVQLALPALEALHAAWDSCLTKAEYSNFWPALTAGVNRIAMYYNRTSVNELYTIAMLLDPVRKGNHIWKYWGKELYEKALKQAEVVYRERHSQLNSSGTGLPKALRSMPLASAYGKIGQLL
ncbi:hypothetical protein L210DRAFT_3645171 [Boletus edulis BED1]|uniref:Uncharacterized protein n=1 Tax=Boletus edulis BED1 TaxID=1328754 RepID=A0AAD4BVB1_BOLED|nr:hypothetical protein L210DRAFT_3645171 [Boletus edulis BED1]